MLLSRMRRDEMRCYDFLMHPIEPVVFYALACIEFISSSTYSSLVF